MPMYLSPMMRPMPLRPLSLNQSSSSFHGLLSCPRRHPGSLDNLHDSRQWLREWNRFESHRPSFALAIHRQRRRRGTPL